MANEKDLTYFTCTLGQAASLNASRPPGFDTVNQLIDKQAYEHGDKSALGFPTYSKGRSGGEDWGYRIFSI